jgi:hypothetical protein
MGLTTFPSGSTRTKNCFVGLVSVRCSERFLPMAMSSLTIPEPAGPLRLQLRSRRRLWSKGSKPYCYKLMRLNVPIGCMINARDAASPANAQLGRGSVSSCFDIQIKRRRTTGNRLQASLRFPRYNDRESKAPRTRLAPTSENQMAVQFGRGGSRSQLQACTFKLRKRRQTPFSSPKTHRPNFTISLATPIECVSISFAIFPGGASEPKGNFSTLSAYTLTKYR